MKEERPDPDMAVLVLAILAVLCWLLLAAGVQAWIQILKGG